MSTPVRFDHFLIQLSTPDFEAPPSWLTDNFTILEGGTHAGGLTRNNLIPLPDGTYIELLNFLPPPPPPSHKDWATKYPGDFALTTLPPFTATDNYNRLVRALSFPPSPHSSSPGAGNLGITYTPPVPGSRTNPSGQEVQWEIIRAKFSSYPNIGPTSVPFFCHDVTDRKGRVPALPAGGHASGAEGVKAVEVVVDRERIAAFAELYAAVLGVNGHRHGDGDWEFPLRAPGAEEVTGSVRLRVARTEEDERVLKERGVGVSALVLRVKGGGELRLPIAEYYSRTCL